MTPARLDRLLLVCARTRLHPRLLERAVARYSHLGEHGACWLGLGLTGAWLAPEPDERRAWLRGVRVVAAAYCLNYAVKLAVRRPRPELDGLPPLTATTSRLSFPSAHSTTSFAAARAFSAVAPARALYGAALLFAASRPYLGVHYPSDAVGGAVLGTAIADMWPPLATAASR